MLKAQYSEKEYMKLSKKRATRSRIGMIVGTAVYVLLAIIAKNSQLLDITLGSTGKLIIGLILISMFIWFGLELILVQTIRNAARESWVILDEENLVYDMLAKREVVGGFVERRNSYSIAKCKKITETYEKYIIYGVIEVDTFGTIGQKIGHSVKNKLVIPKYFDNLDMIMDAFAKKQNIKILN